MNQRDAFSEFDLDAGPETPAHQTPAPAEEMVPKSRLDEVLVQNNELRQGREDVIQSMLNGSIVRADAQVPEEENPLANGFEPVFPEGTEDGVKELLTPILKQNIELAVSGVQGSVDSRLAPVESQMDYAKIIENVRGRVEGFDTVREDVVRLFQNLPPEQRDHYNSEIGIELLAERALRAREDARGARRGMAHSGPVRNAGPGSMSRPEMSPEDVWSKSDTEFEDYVAKRGGRA